jgi:16S rRNA (guanine(527)-N(7))-methyltransferase RsmG
VPRPELQRVPQWFAELLERELRPWIRLSEQQIRQLHAHYELLQLWNTKINLTSIKHGVETVIRHYCESLFFGAHFPGNPVSVTVADLGSGAGFPGFPLAVLKPEWKVAVIESNQRKAVFLRETTRGLDNLSVLAQRAEDVSISSDWLVSRAVSPPEVLKNVPRLASQVGLMLGEEDFSTVKSISNIAWSEPLRLPWGDRRICVFGEVSRGTEH